MSELVGALFLAAVGGFAVHLCRLGTMFIEFDGQSYWVWQRGFLGYNRCRGLCNTEAQAIASIERLKRNPPRII